MKRERLTVDFPLPGEIGLSLGSNLGDRLEHLKAAAGRIAALPGVRWRAASPVYETEPVGVRAEFKHLRYLNAVVIVAYEGALEALAGALHGIEADLGRRRGADRNAPRPIDIDIVYAGRERRSTPALEVPHPRWAERRFVAQPLADVRPDLVLPGRRRTVAQVLARLPGAAHVRRFAGPISAGYE